MSEHPNKNRTIAILMNSLAGKGKAIKLLSVIENKLRNKQLKFNTFTQSWPPNFQGYTDAWLIGGDGTLNHFINRYPDIQVPVALFKGGSGNDFAWKLYGNKAVDAYIESALEGNTKKIDAGICNGKYFINGVGIGFDGEVALSLIHI